MRAFAPYISYVFLMDGHTYDSRVQNIPAIDITVQETLQSLYRHFCAGKSIEACVLESSEVSCLKPLAWPRRDARSVNNPPRPLWPTRRVRRIYQHQILIPNS